jgi:hypothetical protein
MRVEPGAYKSKKDRNGSAYHLHRLNGQATRPAPQSRPKVPSGAIDRADVNKLHSVYSALLSELTLSDAHRENLHQRGLKDEAIQRYGYRSLLQQGRSAIVRKLCEQFNDETLMSVPGFAIKQSNTGPYRAIVGKPGLLIPVRDEEGRIVALKIRRDGRTKNKYTYLSSMQDGGPGPGAPIHVPLGITSPLETVRLTEGELKADIATVLSEIATISIPGATNWKPALEVLQRLGVKIVRLALDADAVTNRNVASALLACSRTLREEGFAVELEQWPLATAKGIDELLAKRESPERLTGDAATQAILEIARSTGIDADDTHGLADLSTLLEHGGPTALFGKPALLECLAKLSLTDPAAFASQRSVLRDAGVRLREFDKAIKPLVGKLVRELPPVERDEGYFITRDGCLARSKQTPDGPVVVPLCNFAARIIEQVTVDDGAERRITLKLTGQQQDGTQLPVIEVPADTFHMLDWVVAKWGTRAIVYAGMGTRDHLRTALQFLSNPTVLTVYSHTGWRKIGDRWCYLHAAGAIGPNGNDSSVVVSLDRPLDLYQLPDPPSGRALVDAVRASLRLLDVASDHVAVSLLAAVYRAVLGACDFSMFLVGRTGIGKSELAALAQQHFGAAFTARHLPGSWSSTGNSLEATAFLAKDALFVVDDFNPTGSGTDVQRFHRDADRLLRAQGNNSGRQRMRPDGTLRPQKPPRGLIVSTGEDVPRGHSLRARTLIVELEAGDVRFGPLTPSQHDAEGGLYAAAMAGYLRWLAPKYEELQKTLRQEVAELRDAAHQNGQHARTPVIVADLAVGWRYFLRFAVDSGAITKSEFAELWHRGWQALLKIAAEQQEHQTAADPVPYFVRLLASALASKRAHVTNAEGAGPDIPEAWGWRSVTIGNNSGWQPQGKQIGWLDGDDLLLSPDAAFAEAQRFAEEQGEHLSIAARTLWKRMNERGMLKSREESRERLTVRRTLEGSRKEVLHVSASIMLPPTVPTVPADGNPREDKSSSGDDKFPNRPTPPPNRPNWDGQHLGGTAENPHSPTCGSENHREQCDLGQLGRSSDSGDTPPVGNEVRKHVV